MFNKTQLVNLRNLSLALHAHAGDLITVPTDAAIVGEADQDEIRVAMMAYVSLIQLNVVNITRALGLSQAETQKMIDTALAA